MAAQPEPLAQAVAETAEFRNEDFERLKILGQGAFATVYLARHVHSSTLVALKECIRVDSRDAHLVDLHAETAAREVMVMEWLQGLPGVVQLIGRYRHHERQVIVMEYVDGCDLFSFLQERTETMTEDEVRPLFTQLAFAIGLLHERGICHRDIKPENILVERVVGIEGDRLRVKLIDFGLCDVLDAEANSSQNVASCGTVDYAAPEIIDAALRPDPSKTYDGAKADVFSLSLVFFIMRFWQYPFSRSQRINSLRRNEAHPPLRYPDGHNSSTEFMDLMAGMMNFESGQRLTIREVLGHPWTTQTHSPEEDRADFPGS